MPESVTITIQEIPFSDGREISKNPTDPTYINLGNGNYAAIFQVMKTCEGLIISTKKPETNVIANVGFGTVVWGCIPALKVEGKEDEAVVPDFEGNFFLKPGNTYVLQLPTGFGERVTRLFQEP